MKDPLYWIGVYCPQGISQKLSDYLQKPVGPDKNFTTRNFIAVNLLKQFSNSTMPFCCVYLGWCSNKFNKSILQRYFDKLNHLTITDDINIISADSLLYELDEGTVLIGGAYPLLELEENERMDEFRKVSFTMMDPELKNDYVNWCFRAILLGALSTDQIGILYSIMSESEALLIRKKNEINNLLCQ